jgi:[ribosomal protein S5]-alanine N-acetyltransferase
MFLRPFIDADTDTIFAVQSHPVVVRYWDSGRESDRAQAERFIAR